MNLHIEQPPTDEYLVPGIPLLQPRETTASPALADLNDRMEELGDRATSIHTLSSPARTDRDRGRPPQAMPCRTTGHSDRPSGRHTKASLNICSLNLNGRGGPVGPQNRKWNEINQLVREDRIGLLCLQETHLSADDSDTVKKLYGRRLAIWNSPSTTASSQQGVAIVLNRELVDTANVHFQVLVPGRAALLRLHWHAEKRLTVLNVYAPNAPRDNAAFWQLLLSMAERGKYQTPDILAGDFNIVEEAIDRLPAKEDNIAAVTSFRDLLRRFHLHDGWCTLMSP